MPLVEAIARDDAFISDEAVRAKYRTPVEKLVGIVQATGRRRAARRRSGPRAVGAANGAAVGDALRTMSYLPFVPPNVGGYPKGARLLGPHSSCTRSTCLQSVADAADHATSRSTRCSRASGSSTSATTRARSSRTQHDPATRLALVVTSPEYTLV